MKKPMKKIINMLISLTCFLGVLGTFLYLEGETIFILPVLLGVACLKASIILKIIQLIIKAFKQWKKYFTSFYP